MKRESHPPLNEMMRAMESAASDLYPFALVCYNGAAWVAEPEILETLFLALEHFWFTEGDDQRLSHKEFREEFFKSMWDRSKGKLTDVKLGEDVPLGHDQMDFFKLPQVSRAAIFLRSKKHFSLASIGLILGLDEAVVREEIEKSREFLLGRSVRSLAWSEEDF